MNSDNEGFSKPETESIDRYYQLLIEGDVETDLTKRKTAA